MGHHCLVQMEAKSGLRLSWSRTQGSWGDFDFSSRYPIFGYDLISEKL